MGLLLRLEEKKRLLEESSSRQTEALPSFTEGDTGSLDGIDAASLQLSLAELLSACEQGVVNHEFFAILKDILGINAGILLMQGPGDLEPAYAIGYDQTTTNRLHVPFATLQSLTEDGLVSPASVKNLMGGDFSVRNSIYLDTSWVIPLQSSRLNGALLLGDSLFPSIPLHHRPPCVSLLQSIYRRFLEHVVPQLPLSAGKPEKQCRVKFSLHQSPLKDAAGRYWLCQRYLDFYLPRLLSGFLGIPLSQCRLQGEFLLMDCPFGPDQTNDLILPLLFDYLEKTLSIPKDELSAAVQNL